MRYVWRMLLIVGCCCLLLVVGAVLFLRTEQFKELLHDQLVSTLNTTLPGDVSLGSIERVGMA